MAEKIIENTLTELKEQLGLELYLCDHFIGVRTCHIGEYFNVLLNDKLSESQDYIKLQRYAKKFKTIHLEPCGVRRLSIFPNQLNKLNP